MSDSTPPTLSPPADPPPPPSPQKKRRLLNGQLLFMMGFALSCGIACYVLKGPEIFWESIEGDAWLLLTMIPVTGGAVILASFAQVLLPTHHVRRWIGQGSGLRG